LNDENGGALKIEFDMVRLINIVECNFNFNRGEEGGGIFY
jgi:hypothetical protein